MFCLIPKSDDDRLPTSSKKSWKPLRRMFKSFKNNDDYYTNYYQYHVHFDDYKKQQQRHSSGATKSSPVEATTVHHAAARALTSTKERAHHVRRSKDEHLDQNDKNGKSVDVACEEFIERLREGWKIERQISAEEYRDMLDRSA